MGTNKLLIEFRGKKLINHILDVLENSKIDETVVVLGHKARDIADAISPRLKYMKTVVNEEYEKGMTSSFKVGLKEVENADAVFLILGDQPFLNSKLINDMLDQMKENQKKALIICPVCEGKKGHPVLFSKSIFREISNLKKEDVIRDVIHRHENRILTIETDRRSMIDIDTPEDIARAVKFLKEETQKNAYT